MDAGEWQPSPDVYDPQGWRMDASSLLGLGPSAAPAIRQSRFFRSIKLPMAALRSLGPVRLGGGTAAVREEFLRCQEALALDEQNMAGEVSLFRRLALDVAGIAESHRDPWRRTTFVHWDTLDEHWRKCSVMYRAGRVKEAAEALTGDQAQRQYARGLLWLEAGEVGMARVEFEATAAGDTGTVKIAAAYWLGLMSPEKEKLTAATL